MTQSRKKLIVFQWAPGSHFGWGVYGLNLMLHWAHDPDLVPISSAYYRDQDIVLEPSIRRDIAPLLEASEAFQRTLASSAGKPVSCSAPVLHALNERLNGYLSVRRTRLRGAANIGILFNIDSTIDDEVRAKARLYDLLVAGSSWNGQWLASFGERLPVITLLQGVDPELFHPGPRSPRFAGRFTVFSGGKVEYRKGQDRTLRAFRAFQSRHAEALLVTAWHSPWPEVVKGIERNGDITAVPFRPDGQPDFAAWAAANGVPPSSFLDLGPVPNRIMPAILRDMDAAIFSNRCEGGTNLVAMEAMACGVPTILSANTGHLDLMGDGISLPLRRQRPIPRFTNCGTEGWGESDTEEMVEALEFLWQNRAAAQEMGDKGAAFMKGLSWAGQLAKLKAMILPMIGA
ncbi:MAG TPA: glycosyltransferase family 4 protein [Stellaceae bacterium]|nr:glycosyltransferase family 4 protein [Stellaceae bacterium]